jgi:hypothetical protein
MEGMRMNRITILREVEQQIKKDFENEIREKESLYTCKLLEWLMRNDVISPDHVEMFVSECVTRTIAGGDRLMVNEFLEAGHV